MVFDNKNGYLYLYGRDDQAFWDIDATGPNHSIFVSLIRYEGSKGSSGSGGSFQDGLDASFNNVDISNNLNIIHGDLETGILQSKRFTYNPISTQKQSVIIAEVEDNIDKLLNATGYFTLELKDGLSASEGMYHTKIHFLAGITTKKGTNSNYTGGSSSSSSTGSTGSGTSSTNPTTNPTTNPITYPTTNPTTNILNSQISQPNIIETLNPGPTTINLQPIQPIVDPTPAVEDDEENTLSVTTLSTGSVPNIEFNGFIKVLSCIRQWHDPTISNIGIESLELAHDVTNYTNKCFLILNLNVDDTQISALNFNIRLYKNSLNILNTLNHLQWTLTDSQTPDPATISLYKISKLYIGAGSDDPNNPTNALYPRHPEEPFTATTQYTVVDNDMNVYGNLYIKGDINGDSSLNLDENINMSVEKKIVNPNYGIFEEKYYNNSDFKSGDGSVGPGNTGQWVTIARTNISTDAKTRTASAIFEIIDKSNTKANVANTPNGNIDPGFFDEYILVSVSWYYDTYTGQQNFHDVDNTTNKIQPPICSINVLNSRCGNNYNPYPVGPQQPPLGILSGIRVQTAFSTNNAPHGQAIAHLQLQRIASGSNVVGGNPSGAGYGFTDLKVRMFGNEKSNDALFWELESVQHTMHTNVSNRFNTEFNLEKNVTGLVSDSNIPKNTIQYRDGIIMDSNEKVTIKSIDELNISCDDKIKILVDDNTPNANEILLGNKNNESTHSISFSGGNTAAPFESAILNLNGGSSGDRVKTYGLYYQDKDGNGGVGDTLFNNVYTKGNNTDELCNPALVQTQTINLGSGSGGLNVANNDWVTIAVSGKANLISRRASALFELTDRTSGHHHSIVFRAGIQFTPPTASEYARQKTNFIDVISNTFYSSNRFNKLRMKYGRSVGGNPSVFSGAVLQVQIDNSNSSQLSGNIYLKIYQNTKNGGWISNSSVITNYGLSDSIPVWDTTESANSGQFYDYDKTISIGNNNHITTTQEKTFKFCGSGITVTNTEKFYLDTIKDSDTGWDAEPSTGSETQIKLDRRGINMNKSTITNLWEIPSDWIPHITQQPGAVFGPNIDKVGGTAGIASIRRSGVAVSLKTLQDFYQQMDQPINLFRGGETKIQQSLSKTTLTDAFNKSDAFLAMLSEGPETTTNTKKNNAIVYRNAFMNGVYNVGTSNMNLAWRTRFSSLQTTTNGDSSTGFEYPYSIGLTGIVDTITGGVKRMPPGPTTTTSDSQRANWYWTNGNDQNDKMNVFNSGNSSTDNYVTFRGKTSAGSNQTFSEFKNDTLFLAGDGEGFQLFGTNNKWHIMPQKNTSAYVLSAYLYVKHQANKYSIDFGGTPDNAASEVQFILCGVTFSGATNGSNTIRELSTLATITNDSASNDELLPPSWSRLHNTGTNKYDNNWIRWYPNGGNGEFSKGIYIGRTGDQQIGGSFSEQRFDALSIRVKVRVKNSNSSNSAPSVTIYGSSAARVGFHISSLIRSVP